MLTQPAANEKEATMEDIEVLKHAQKYIEQMANGINPLTGEAVKDDDMINNVRISRCLFYVNDKLKSLILNGGRVSKGKGSLDPFVYDEQKMAQVEISDAPTSISEVIRRVKAVFGDNIRLTYAMVAEALYKKGVFVDNPEGRPKYIASKSAAELGIWSEVVKRITGDEHTVTLFDSVGQKYLLGVLKDLSA